jgi:single-strand DNA-binding protein
MASVNKVILIGNLGKDPELRYTAAGSPVCKFSLATTKKIKEKSVTTWHNMIAWGKTAELCGQYLHKGDPCYFEGEIENRSWEDRDGNRKYMTEINIRNVQFLNRRENGNAENQEPAVAAEDVSQEGGNW